MSRLTEQFYERACEILVESLLESKPTTRRANKRREERAGKKILAKLRSKEGFPEVGPKSSVVKKSKDPSDAAWVFTRRVGNAGADASKFTRGTPAQKKAAALAATRRAAARAAKNIKKGGTGSQDLTGRHEDPYDPKAYKII